MRRDPRGVLPRHVVLAVDDPGLRAALAAAIGMTGRTATILPPHAPLPPGALIVEAGRLDPPARAHVSAGGLDGAAMVLLETQPTGETRVCALDPRLSASELVATAFSPARR